MYTEKQINNYVSFAKELKQMCKEVIIKGQKFLDKYNLSLEEYQKLSDNEKEKLNSEWRKFNTL